MVKKYAYKVMHSTNHRLPGNIRITEVTISVFKNLPNSITLKSYDTIVDYELKSQVKEVES